jgi:hypothetical protein
MNDRNKCDGVTLGMNQDYVSVEDRPSGTYPGTEQRPMCRRLMLRMVSGMFRRLRLRQSTYSEDTEHKRHRQEFAECVTHASTTLL